MEVTRAINNKLFFLHRTPHIQKPFSLSQYLRSDIRRSLTITCAKKKKKKTSKPSSHRPDPNESWGFFPEAVLLRKKKVQEDGTALPEFADEEEEKLYETLSLQMESDLNLERMRHYQLIVLIHENHDDETDEVVAQIEDFIRGKKGRIWRINDWGLRSLAYKIKKTTHAHYVLMNFELDTKFTDELKMMLDKDERVLRHMVSKEKEAKTEYVPPPMEYDTVLLRDGYGDGIGTSDFFDMDDDEEDEEDEEEDEDGEVIYVDDEDEDEDEDEDKDEKIDMDEYMM